jgi:hypothetical protein
MFIITQKGIEEVSSKQDLIEEHFLCPNWAKNTVKEVNISLAVGVSCIANIGAKVGANLGLDWRL